MPYPFTPCRRATPGVTHQMVGGLWPSSTPLDTPSRTRMVPCTVYSLPDRHTMGRNVSKVGLSLDGISRPRQAHPLFALLAVIS
jgi:hypothetical protein